MSFREINQRYLFPGSQVLMIFGIVSLCQPWISVLHIYSVAIMLAGLVGFNITSKIKPAPSKENISQNG